VSAEASREQAEPAAAGDRALPNFLIIGAMRSGTTSLTRYLRSNPQVFMAQPKELHYFDFEFDRGVDWYRRHFDESGGVRAVGEATPNYLYLAEAMPRLAALVPDARLVAILRNPVDRAYSHYWHNRSVGREELSFEDALTAEAERIRSDDPHPRAYWSYVDRGRYVHQLRRIEDLYPRDSLQVLLFEDLLSEPERTYRSMCRFIGADPDHRPPELGEAVNGFVTFRSRTLRSLTQHMPKSARRAVGRLNARSESYPPMSAAARERLAEGFRADNAALAGWLGRDLVEWDG
jgi:hypothetical protein